MKKLLTLALLSFTLLQSCTVDEAEVAPDKLVTPAGVNIENAVKSMKGFVLEDYKAILLKPVDNDPKTNLTTLFLADAKGKIWPLLENFEVKDVRVTTNGIYVLTNYSGIAFFVKYDNSWVELKNVGDYIIEEENGNILFSNGATLNTKSLTVERSSLTTSIVAKSGNLILLAKSNGDRRIVNTVTKVGMDIFGCTSPSTFLESFHNDEIAVVDDCGATFNIFDLKNGSTEWVHYSVVYEPAKTVRTKDGLIVVSKEWVAKSSPDYTPAEARITNLTFKYTNSGQVTYGFSFAPYEGKPLPAPYVLTEDLSFLNLSHINSYKLAESLVYYSGTRNGQPVTGVYNKDTKQDMVVAKDTFSNIQLL